MLGKTVRKCLPTITLYMLLAAGSPEPVPGAMTGNAQPDRPLPASEATGLAAALERHVRRLAEDIGERHLQCPEALEEAAAAIEELWKEGGLSVRRQAYEVEGKTVRNIEVELAGTDRREEIVLFGAHYDSVPGSPGANDNASGVAALIELARLLQGRSLSRTVRLVAFVNEEPPFFQTEAMGSRHYARRARSREEKIVAMFSLETIGWYQPEEGSQRYPSPLLGLFYPSRGNFIAFVGNLSSTPLLRRSLQAFRRHSDFAARGLAAPQWVDGVGWSDQWSFWREGYRAVMITDTAPFRYPYYHRRGDTAEKLDYPAMAQVVAGLAAMAAELAHLRD